MVVGQPGVGRRDADRDRPGDPAARVHHHQRGRRRPRVQPPAPLRAAHRAIRFRYPSKPGDPPQAPVSLITVLLVPVIAAIVTVAISGNWKLIFIGLLSPLGALLTRSGSRRRSLQDYDRRVKTYGEAMERATSDIE